MFSALGIHSMVLILTQVQGSKFDANRTRSLARSSRQAPDNDRPPIRYQPSGGFVLEVQNLMHTDPLAPPHLPARTGLLEVL